MNIGGNEINVRYASRLEVEILVLAVNVIKLNVSVLVEVIIEV